ncbi:CaiB/BaiF CoA transferase family protein [Streptomyces malaysiensis]|uniref:CaiB/BaiF CoA transferase family protein n=1 Tax=Streptomyces malaysiensis TaxID=92644 RepID=UPI002B29A9E1|nr:CaiB/BaiF CoA-transferase family protein [Streptomyces malaysiensis]
MTRSGPLAGVRVVELAGLGPAPHACTLLADMGADVIRIARPQAVHSARAGDPLTRGRPSVALDLKRPAAVETVMRLVERADIFVEGNRPGVTERLGTGPAQCLARNPRLVYGRMTGWGQEGPLSSAAGHDLTYVATTGVLFGLGQSPDTPHFPTTLLGDFGGGSTYLVIGVLAALVHAKTTGHGQVVDAAIVDGTSHLTILLAGMRAKGRLTQERGTNLLDGGAPYYALYATSDERHVAVGALEPQFFDLLISTLGVKDSCPPQHEVAQWPRMRRLFAETFKTRTMAEWADIFEGTDACLAPVLTPAEAEEHAHIRARGIWIDIDGVSQPAPAPRFSRTPGAISAPPAASNGADTAAALQAWGIDDIDALLTSGAAVQD